MHQKLLLFSPWYLVMRASLSAAALLLLMLLVRGEPRAEVGLAKAFARAEPDRVLSFPADFGAHPEFETEWWYFTGQLFEADAKPFQDAARYGFQLTFFRRASSAKSEHGLWDQAFLAHAALSDLNAKSFTFEKRTASGGLGLAGARTGGLRAWNRDWKAEMIGDAIVLEFSVDSHGQSGASVAGDRAEVRLIARLIEPPVLHGAKGYSVKGSCEGCASHYYSLPRLELNGHVRRGERQQQVHGVGWMDHEFMTNALSSQQVGWDWLSLNQSDGRSVMLFQLRNHKGGVDFASGSIIEREGAGPPRVRGLSAHEFTLEAREFWTSPTTRGTYPIRWNVRVPSAGISVEVAAALLHQELVFPSQGEAKEGQSLSYWEGAVSSADQSVIGYLEMTGYAGAMGDLL